MKTLLTNSLPEQLAQHVGCSIMTGRYAEGERLIEAEIASLFSVSWRTVRDAFILLERRRFITIEPRKGAYVRPITLDSIADVFNVRTSLFATAARFMAGSSTKSSLRELSQDIQLVQNLAGDKDTSAANFLAAVNRTLKTVVFGSGSELIAELLCDLEQHTVWASLWVEPAHFQTLQGRGRKAQLIANIGHAVEGGDVIMAESSMRSTTNYSRDEIIGKLVMSQDKKVS